MRKKFLNYSWDLICLASIIGIWPRYIEPNLLKVTREKLVIPRLSKDLEGIRLLQFSDLHINPQMPDSNLKKLVDNVRALNPDMIFFTGDLLCNARLDNPDRLESFLNEFSAPLGCYLILGNHDYAQAIGINEEGDYDVISNKPWEVAAGISRVLAWNYYKAKRKVTERAKKVGLNPDLMKLLEKTPFKALHNESALVAVKNSFLNVVGLGEYSLDKTRPEQAFASYNPEYPGIILSHNPDSVPSLVNYPGDIILCGHTHGAQINLPYVWRRITLLENENLKRGNANFKDKRVYINRGIGSCFRFRFFSTPEITQFTLKGQP